MHGVVFEMLYTSSVNFVGVTKLDLQRLQPYHAKGDLPSYPDTIKQTSTLKNRGMAAGQHEQLTSTVRRSLKYIAF